jgi:hypothetical protein
MNISEFPFCTRKIACTVFFIMFFGSSHAQWPKELTTKNGTIISIYQPQPESLKGSQLDGRAAFSVHEKGSNEPQFGVFWYTTTIHTNRDDHSISLQSIVVQEVKLPGVADTSKVDKLKKLLEEEIPKWELTGTFEEITATIEQQNSLKTEDLKNDPPVVHFVSQPTTLVLIDGEPKVQMDNELKVNRVINSAFLIVQASEDNQYYLFGGDFWYVSSSVKEGYQYIVRLPKSVSTLDQQLKKQQPENTPKSNDPAPAILVSTVPAELIQSKGTAQYANIEGTSLLYVSNSSDDIFKFLNDQLYYVLISGRWYTSQKLEGPWAYVQSDKLPEDFSKIPEGSAKDNVLSSVAGTPASVDAIRDAQVPQTAKVDRKTASCTVAYDGEPKFENIEGTSLQLAVNTSSTVLKSGSKYYCVDKGVWFEAMQAKGPWKVSEERPKDVDMIPASSPAYNVKYVYIYETTPEVVYVGYTPGYMGCYVYGPTVVYGTGYYYSPWYGPYYYPRPVTYGFSMHYNPWTGWGMGFHYSTGWLNFSFYGGGYWGPPMYRPPYHPPYHGGIYGGRPPVHVDHYNNINSDRSNNIYNNRNGVSTREVKRGQGGQNPSVATRDRNTAQSRPASPVQQPAGANRPNNVYSDKSGNVYQRDNNGNWNQRNGDKWEQAGQSQERNRDYQNRQRSTQNNSGFQQMNRGGNMGGNMGGGGARMGGRRR